MENPIEALLIQFGFKGFKIALKPKRFGVKIVKPPTVT